MTSSQQAAAGGRRDRPGFVSILALISGASLAGFGAISLIVSVFSLSLIGMAVSCLLLIHGIVELTWRRRLASGEARKASRAMAINQVGLACSVTLYAAWQIVALDPGEVRRLLLRPAVRPVFEMYPPSLQADLWQNLPAYVQLLYGLVIAVAWIGCLATAVYYWLQGRKLAARG